MLHTGLRVNLSPSLRHAVTEDEPVKTKKYRYVYINREMALSLYIYIYIYICIEMISSAQARRH